MHLLFLLSTLLMVQDDKKPEFEVASIKPAAPDARGMWVRNAPGGRVNITNMSLKEIIVMAYRIQPYQISGGPAWLDKDRYDITAKAEKEPKQGEWNLLLQSLLADRFQLALRKETKELPIYALVVARKDGKLGPKLTESKDEGCVKIDPTHPPDQRHGEQHCSDARAPAGAYHHRRHGVEGKFRYQHGVGAGRCAAGDDASGCAEACDGWVGSFDFHGATGAIGVEARITQRPGGNLCGGEGGEAHRKLIES
jgi:hypothetical protein